MNYRRNKPYSAKALNVKNLAAKQGIRIYSDPDWSLAEAASIETPIGVIHLHWTNHRGRGHWNLVTKPVGHICKTARCRVVTITPHGGDNESAPLDQKLLAQVMDDWYKAKDDAYQAELEAQNEKWKLEHPIR